MGLVSNQHFEHDCLMMVMELCNMPTSEYDFLAIMIFYQAIQQK